MINFFLIITLFLLIVGIIGSLIPGLPGPVFSILGVLLYWWSTSYQTPGNLFLILMLSTAILALIIDYIGAYIGAEKSGSSTKTAIAASVSALIFFLFTGPIGIILGVGVVVFLREILIGKDPDEAITSATATTIALLASTASKALLTTLVLIIFLISILV